MTYPITVTVRYRAGAHHCRFPNGARASSTNSAEVAIERLMDKVWEPGTHRASVTGRSSDATYFEINPIR